MDKWVYEYLYGDLTEAHCAFENIINEMTENGIDCTKYIAQEKSNYDVAYEALLKMQESYLDYNKLIKENDEFFNGELKITSKYIMLFLVSIIIIKVFAKTLSVDKINEIWYALLGLVLGSANVSLINKRINEYRYGNKERRLFMDELYSLKEDYEDNFNIARKRVSYIFNLNKELEKEISKVYIKKIKYSS